MLTTTSITELKKIMLTHLVLEARFLEWLNKYWRLWIINPKDTSLNMAERMTILFKNSGKYYNNNRTNNKYRFVIKMWYRKYHSSSNCRRRNNTLVRFCLRRNTPRDKFFYNKYNKHHHILCWSWCLWIYKEAVVATVNPLPASPLIAVSSISPFYIVKRNETAIPLSAIPSLNCRLGAQHPNGDRKLNKPNSIYYSNRHNILLCESNKYLNRLWRRRSEIIVIVNHDLLHLGKQ
jgi:hypothetical protein